MDRDRFVEEILHGSDKSSGASIARALLAALAGLHRFGLEAYLLPFRFGIRKRTRLPVPVIAIGNLSSGGTGKTPMAALVAGRLKSEGRRVVVLSRGHGGSGESGRISRVVSDGLSNFLGPDEAGDEPVLLSRLLPGVPVIVGRDRRLSGKLAMERFAPDVIVLDDALQYWQLHRDLDIVLLDARRPFDNGYVLPRGLLREPPSHLLRAGIVVLTRSDRISPDELDTVRAQVSRLAPHAVVFAATHAPLGWLRSSDGESLPLESFTGETVFAFSGIADGHAFQATVERQTGAALAGGIILPDHAVYSVDSVREIAAGAVRGSAKAVVTTEKDMVKVGPLWPNDAPPLYALRIGIKLDNEARFFETMDAAIGGAKNLRV